MFDKILIANRGEIAVRIALSARRLGISCVAVYSDPDRDAMHVDACDEAYRIGPAAASESYLNIAAILEVALECGAQAIHPGYGFGAENPAFARACEAEGIVFIGPPAAAITAMGSKIEAKAVMQAAGVQLVPGYDGADQKDDYLLEESRLVGYPQLIKASAGGGGKGMRRVDGEKEFLAALASARREAVAAFGDDRVLIERYMENTRHIEMQVFADRHGNYVHLFERDCSVQRRHQKILEEAPAPGIGDELRAAIGKAAIDCARAIDYVGAGTVEFLLDGDGEFYFMEMNTRLQVEHAVTEMITGQDLIEWQLRVAAGERLPLTQEQVQCNGHAIEARIYAENPEREFMPAAGRIRYLAEPEPVDGLRVDTGVRRGDEIGIHYDPMISKLIVHGVNRDIVLSRLGQALRQYRILGVDTNLAFLARLVALPGYAAAEIDTGFIERHRDVLFGEEPQRQALAAILAAAAILPGIDVESAEAGRPWESLSHWRMNLDAAQRVELESAAGPLAIAIRREQGHWRFELGEVDYRVVGSRLDDLHMRVRVDGRLFEYPVLRTAGSVALSLDAEAFEFGLAESAGDADAVAADAGHPRAPMSGAVVALPVAVGDTVEPGQTLMIIEAMKMEHAIVAETAGTVSEILFAVGDQVDEDQTLMQLEVN